MGLWSGGGWGIYRILGEIQSNTSVALSFRTLAVLAYRLLLVTFHMSVSAGETAGSGSAVLDRGVELFCGHLAAGSGVCGMVMVRG